MELSAQELRIGNLVSILGKERELIGITKRNGKNETALYYAEFKGIIPIKLMHLKPIPLTEEWLLKLGFEYHPSRHENRAFRKGKLEIVLSGNYIYTNGRTYYNSWCIIESQPKTVHQLQNLYFALTGEELTIKQTESI